MNKAKVFSKQFRNVSYSTGKINRHIDHTIKTFPLTKYYLPISYVSETAQTTTGPDGINIKHLKNLTLAIRYFASIYNTTLNTNTVPHLGETNHNNYHYKTKQGSQHWHKLLIHITFITHYQNTRENTTTINNRKHSSYFISININTQHTLLHTTSIAKSQKASTIQGNIML